MRMQRARQIANAFGAVRRVDVREVAGGLLVRHDGVSCYFVREACFWPYVFRIAGESETLVAELEMRLAA